MSELSPTIDKNRDTAPAKEAAQETSSVPQWLPEPAKDAWRGVGSKVAQWRYSTILATPSIVVNNSSNFLSASHVVTEMLMFKSGMPGNKLVDDPSKPINWVVQPVQKIWRDTFGGKSRGAGFKELFRRSPIENFEQFKDMHGASLREVERQISENKELVAVGKAAKPIKLGNPWQTRTTSVGLVTFILGALIPDRKESDEEIERMARMRTLNPVRYVFERYKQAVWVPEWPKHKRELMGLGFNIIGTVSMLGAWRNRGMLNPAIAKEAELIAKGLDQGYKFNSGYFYTGLVSFVQGFPLLFALDENKGYSTYGAMAVFRTPMLFKSIHQKYAKRESGWLDYLIAKVTFQLEDFMFLLIGGATKKVHADGTVEIIDHEKLKKDAIKEAKIEKAQHKVAGAQHGLPVLGNAKHADAPTHVITQAMDAERAMPERLEKQEQRGDAANDAQMTVAVNSR